MAHELVEKKLAACVSIENEIKSCYRWKQKLEYEPEISLRIKTIDSRIEDIKEYFDNYHPYECPQLIITTAKIPESEYQEWFLDQVK